MKLLKTLVLPFSFVICPAFVYGDSQLRNFLSVNSSPSLETIVDFLHEHRRDPTWCNSITLQFDVAKTTQTSALDWRKVSGIFITLFNKMDQSQSSNMQWLDLLGSPIKEIILNSGKEKGIPGKLDGSRGDVLSLKLRIDRAEICTHDDWLAMIQIILEYIHQLYTAVKEQNILPIKQQLGIPLQTILETPTIDKTLCITFYDKEGYSLYLQFNNKN